MFGHDILLAGSADVVVAGGQESMSNAPYLLLKGRQGYRYGHATVYDHMALDGLEDAYDRGKAMGVFAEDCAAKYSFTREQQDAYSLESLRRRSEEHTSELQSLMRISYAVFCLTKKITTITISHNNIHQT